MKIWDFPKGFGQKIENFPSLILLPLCPDAKKFPKMENSSRNASRFTQSRNDRFEDFLVEGPVHVIFVMHIYLSLFCALNI